jgi:predicted DNA-binding transcriptional regulator AlpA
MGEWAGAAEIATLLGVSRQRVQQLVNRPDFPEPDIELEMGRIWKTEKIRQWAETRGRDLHD